jgi:hypothetical protein
MKGMKRIAAVILASVLSTVPSFAQQKPSSADQLRHANRKITIGLVLMGVGALLAPVTALGNQHHGDPGGGTGMKLSIAMVGVGSGVAWWGASERRRVLQPQTVIGVDVGSQVGIYVGRSW